MVLRGRRLSEGAMMTGDGNSSFERNHKFGGSRSEREGQSLTMTGQHQAILELSARLFCLGSWIGHSILRTKLQGSPRNAVSLGRQKMSENSGRQRRKERSLGSRGR
jgi:hypothetical protein